MNFDCGGGTKHLNWALQTQACPYGENLAGDAIGWNGKTGEDSQIAGVDVPTAQLRETYTKVFKRAKLTTQYKRNVAALVGCVNSDTFKGWFAGEVMFLGCSFGATTADDYVTVSYNFAIQPNETSATVAGHNIGEVLGWQYVWAVYKTGGGTSTQPGQQEPDQIYIADVADYKPFAALGI